MLKGNKIILLLKFYVLDHPGKPRRSPFCYTATLRDECSVTELVTPGLMRMIFDMGEEITVLEES